MARSSGCSVLAVVVVAAWAGAHRPRQAAAQPGDQAPAAPCTRKRAEADLRARDPRKAVMRRQIDVELERCVRDRLAACQLALDADVDEGLTCWKQAPWPEVPATIQPEEVVRTGLCLVELKAVITDLRRCRTKKPEARHACVTPYIGYAPECGLLKAERVWRAFPGREDIERAAQAPRDPKAAKEQAAREAKEARLRAEQEAKEARLRAEQEAKEARRKAAEDARRKAEEARLAREAERCFGRTTLEFADKLQAQPGPRAVAGCKYQVSGRVISQNNVFVQLVGPSGTPVFLLRTKEPFAEGTLVADRTAAFDSIEEAELADGSKRSFAVFKLDPPPRPRPQP